MREFTIEKFRKFLPRQATSRPNRHVPPHISPEGATHLLHRARKYASTLQRANQGYLTPLLRILRMSYGRIGSNRVKLLIKFIYPRQEKVSGNASPSLENQNRSNRHDEDAEGEDQDMNELAEEDESEWHETDAPVDHDTFYPSLKPTVSTNAFTAFYAGAKVKKPFIEKDPPRWKLDVPPQFQGLLFSQAHTQGLLVRGESPRMRKLKTHFSPPTHTIWHKPLPLSRYKNLRKKWYDHNMKILLPPLGSEQEYWDLHDMVTGKKEIPPFIPRRTPRELSDEEIGERQLQAQSDLVLEGPKFGARGRDIRKFGRPHQITPRVLQRMLARNVLAKTPLVKKAAPMVRTEANCGLVFHWDDGLTAAYHDKWNEAAKAPTSEQQDELLFA
jgi:hypothetical protein